MRRNTIAPLFLSLIALRLAVPAFGAETAVVTEGKVNVRGKPSFAGEVITQLERGEKITVLERITVEKPKPGEPTNWARIKLPANTPVWVFAPFVKDDKVAASRLNLRAGPGENWSVVGRLNRGDAVKPIRTVVEWMEIEAPEGAYAFIDLSLVRFDSETNTPPAAVLAEAPPAQSQDQPVAPPATETPTPPAIAAPTGATTEAPTTNAVPAAAVDAPGTIEITTPNETSPLPPDSATNVATLPEAAAPAAPVNAPEPLPTIAPPIPARRDEPLPKRIVRREGVIRATRSIQAPTWYELVHADTGKTINYLYDAKLSDKMGIKLKDYRGQKVVVSGEEAIDPRWPNTPIMDLETLDVLP